MTVRGDNGVVIQYALKNEEGKYLDLSNSTVELTIQKKKDKITKPCVITDALNGTCEATLNSEDLDEEGVYLIQATVKYNNGDKFTANEIGRLPVNRKL